MKYGVVALVDPALSHLDRVFTYSGPDDLVVGALVKVPFRGRSKRGVVVQVLDSPDIEKPAPMGEVLGPGIGEELTDLARWVAARYLSTLPEAIAAMVPARTVAEEKDAPFVHEYDVSAPAAGGAFRRAPSISAEARTARDARARREGRSEGFEEYEHGAVLMNAIGGDAGTFVWRPGVREERAATIVRACETALARRRSVVVLVPEVRTPSDTARALLERFGDGLARLGADRSPRERYRDWLALRAGAKRIAVGGRATVFAPVRELGLIVIDDEAHASYKEGRAPRFHARTVAAERARRNNATLLLAGVPPSVDARIAAQRAPTVFLAPSRNAQRNERTPVSVVDTSGTSLTPDPRTLAAVKEALQAGKRAVVIAHRAGEDLATIAARTFRISGARNPLRLEAGPEGKGTGSQGKGRGTEAGSLMKLAKKADCVVASPYLAKDVMLENVGTLAIVDADAALSQPEFRAAEEAFATWWRALRWAPDRVVIETANPDHPAIAALVRWDPDVLVKAEAAKRKELRYPPFASLARIDVPADRAAGIAKELEAEGCEVLGPAESDGRTVVIVRATKREDLLQALLPFVTRWRATDEPMRVDVDPWEVFVPRWHS